MTKSKLGERAWLVVLGASLLAGAAAPAAPPSPAPPTTTSTTGVPDAAEAAQIATEAYVFGYPLVTMHMTKAVMTNIARPAATKAPAGQFASLGSYPTPAFKDVTAPNADTVYSAAWFDLSKEPYVFSHPDMGDRYFLFPMLDAWTNVIDVPGARTTGGKAATYVIVGPDWKGKLPPEAKPVRSPTSTLWLLGRTYCTGTPQDYQAVHALQKQYTLYPLSAWGTRYEAPAGRVNPAVDMKTPVRDQVDALSGGRFFELLAILMKDNPPSAADAPVLDRMAKIGLRPGQPFDPSKGPAVVSRAVQAAPSAGQAAIKELLKKQIAGASSDNGWLIAPVVGVYGTHYLDRAAVAAAGLGANRKEDAIYPVTDADSAGQKLTGTKRYLLHFAKGQMPPVKGFWSLTMYDSKLFFVANPLDRYTLSGRDKLASNPDGSVDLYVQADEPAGHKSNWLPAPRGPFVLMMRLYWPNETKPSILDGSWKPPAVTPQAAQGPRMGRSGGSRPRPPSQP